MFGYGLCVFLLDVTCAAMWCGQKKYMYHFKELASASPAVRHATNWASFIIVPSPPPTVWHATNWASFIIVPSPPPTVWHATNETILAKVAVWLQLSAVIDTCDLSDVTCSICTLPCIRWSHAKCLFCTWTWITFEQLSAKLIIISFLHFHTSGSCHAHLTVNNNTMFTLTVQATNSSPLCFLWFFLLFGQSWRWITCTLIFWSGPKPLLWINLGC